MRGIKRYPTLKNIHNEASGKSETNTKEYVPGRKQKNRRNTINKEGNRRIERIQHNTQCNTITTGQ